MTAVAGLSLHAQEPIKHEHNGQVFDLWISSSDKCVVKVVYEEIEGCVVINPEGPKDRAYRYEIAAVPGFRGVISGWRGEDEIDALMDSLYNKLIEVPKEIEARGKFSPERARDILIDRIRSSPPLE